VVRAKAAFEENGFFYASADLNQDGRITYLDVDLITDLVNIPDPTGVLIASDEDNKRGLAPLGAICQAAIKPQGGCKLQPPFFVRSDNTPSRLVCTVAEGLVSGCKNQIVGCETFAPTGCVAIQPSTAVNGALADTDQESLVRVGSFGDCYTFSGTAGQMIDIRTISQEFDTYLFLLGPQGDVIALNDDCDDSTTNACLLGAQSPLPTDGAYTIEVTSFLGNATGNYTLTVGQ
jgi:hypothetical protein